MGCMESEAGDRGAGQRVADRRRDSSAVTKRLHRPEISLPPPPLHCLLDPQLNSEIVGNWRVVHIDYPNVLSRNQGSDFQ
eukprot:753733-Hanusia_phi.AAC.1